MPQLRTIDGVEISSEEKIKAENLHGFDLKDREIIFKSLLPEEKYVDRRIGAIEQVTPESESEEEMKDGSAFSPSGEGRPPENFESLRSHGASSSITSTRMNRDVAR